MTMTCLDNSHDHPGSRAHACHHTDPTCPVKFEEPHYMDNVWDETEVSAVSGHPVASFRRARREFDDLRASDVADDRQEDLRVAVARFESLTDEQLTTGRPARWLRGVVEAAQAHDVSVSERLITLGQHAQPDGHSGTGISAPQ
jgi:hypothetical protein